MLESSLKFRKKEIVNLPVDKQVNYANKHLSRLAVIFDNLWKQKDFKNLIISALEEKKEKGFETEILFKEMLSMIEENSINISTKQLIEFEDALDAFDGILENEPTEPQIYFPFLSALTSDNKSSQTEPVYAFSTDPSEPNEVKTYHVENNNIIELPGTVNEAQAQQIAEFFVLGINEFNPADYPDYHPIIIQDTMLVVDQISVNPYNQGYGDLYLNRIKITEHKESWIKGASEVHYNAVAISDVIPFVTYSYGNVYNEDIQHPFYINASYSGGYAGYNFATWNRNQMGDVKEHPKLLKQNFLKTLGNVDQNLLPNYLAQDFNRNPESVYVIVFEYDGWPTSQGNGNVPQPITSIYNGSFVSLVDNDADPTTGDYVDPPYNITFRTNNSFYGMYVVFNLAHTGFNEVNPGYYNINDTDEVIQTAPFHRSGMPYIMHKTVLH